MTGNSRHASDSSLKGDKRNTEASLPFEHSGKFFQAVLETSRDAIIVMDNKGQVVYWNPAAQQIFNYTQDEMLGKNLHLLLAPKRFHEAYKRGFAKFVETGEGGAVEKTLELAALRRDGKEFPIELSLSAIEENGNWYAVGIVRDISERKNAEEDLRESEVKHRILLNSIRLPVVGLKEDMTVLYCNDTYAAYAGKPTSELEGKNIAEVLPEFKESDSHSVYQRVLNTWQSEVIERLSGDGERYLREHIYRTPWGILATFEDITEQHRAQESVREMATRDPLTRLLNRYELFRTLGTEVERCNRYRRNFCFLYVDIDHFKEVNDTYGHAAGDTVLRDVAQIIRRNARRVDTVARYGGEEIAVVMPETSKDSAVAMAERIRESVQDARIIVDNNKDLSVTISIGVSEYPVDGQVEDEIIKRADQALYEAKNAGRNRVVVYEAERSNEQSGDD